jgi:hypothetical protein
MRWVRKRSAIVAMLVLVYFFAVYFQHDGRAVLAVTVMSVVMVFGSAMLDRITYDPSAIFIDKPWRTMRPSAGDFFRFICCGLSVGLTLPLLVIRGSLLAEPALFEAGLIALALFGYEWTRFNIERVRWFGSGLDVRSKIGRQVTFKWTDIVDVRADRFGDALIFRDKSGRNARIDRRLRGYSECGTICSDRAP